MARPVYTVCFLAGYIEGGSGSQSAELSDTTYANVIRNMGVTLVADAENPASVEIFWLDYLIFALQVPSGEAQSEYIDTRMALPGSGTLLVVLTGAGSPYLAYNVTGYQLTLP